MNKKDISSVENEVQRKDSSSDENLSTLSRFNRHPVVLIVLGLVFLVPSILSMIIDLSFNDIIFGTSAIILGSGMIIGGIMRVKKKNTPK